MSDLPLIGPQVQYPTPWRVAEETNGVHVIVAAEGHQAATASSYELAELIVRLANMAAEDGVTR